MASPINKISPLAAERLTFHAKILHGTNLEDILKPEYWANVSKNLIAHKTHIEADWEDGTRLVILRVVGVGLNHAKVRVISDHSFVEQPATQVAPSGAEAADDFEISYKTHHHKWSIIRKADKSYVKDQFDSQPQAAEWLQKYLAGEITLDKAA